MLAKMAGGQGDPPDRLWEKYKCCGKKCSTLTCIVCESKWHPSCASRMKKDFVNINDSLLICDDHAGKDITSNINKEDLSEPLRLLIVQIKLKSSEQLRKEILSEVANKIQDLHNATIFSNETDFELLKTENMLQKELIKEFQEKKQLLRELLNEKKKVDDIKSYAEIASFPKQQVKRVPKIIIKPNNKNNFDKARIKQNVGIDNYTNIDLNEI